MSALQVLAVVAGAVSAVSAHGHVSGIVIGGKYYQGYDASFQYSSTPPTVIGWSTPEVTDNGFVAPSEYSNADIICHKGATPGGTHATVAAGDKVELQWTPWPESHHGPVLDYLAKCSGKCEDADKESLDFFKIAAGGLISGSPSPGEWASDTLIANNNSWTVTIPSSIAAGNYVLRHEIIALHSAGNEDGAQNYPQCVNLQVTGGGSDNPTGEPATEFYSADDAGILVDIYNGLSSYKIPGPPVYSGGSSSPTSAPAPAPSSSAAPVSSDATTPSSAPLTSSAPAGSITYSAPASPSSSAGATTSVAYSYSAPPASSSVGAGSSSAATSPSKCTTRITITASSSAGAVTSSGAASSSSYPVSLVTSSSPGGYPAPSSLTAPISSGAPSSSYVPSGGLPSGGLPSGGLTFLVPIASSSYAIPTISASAPAGYPTGTPRPPPAGGDVDMETLMAKIIKMIKQMFRAAEHGRDFKRRI